MIRRAALALALGAAIALGSALPASAAPVSEVIEGEHLRLVSTGDPVQMRDLVPGVAAVWLVSVSADAPEPGIIDISLTGSGELPLTVDARSCAAAWEASVCTVDEAELALGLLAPLDGTSAPLLRVPADRESHLRLEVALAPDVAAPTDATTRLLLRADGWGDTVEAPPPGEGALPPTGTSLSGIALLTIGAVIVGVAGSRLALFRREVTE